MRTWRVKEKWNQEDIDKKTNEAVEEMNGNKVKELERK